MEKMFNARHIIVHEVSSYDIILIVKVTKCIDTAIKFMKASWDLIANTLEPDYPLTQAEINIQASGKFDIAEGELQHLITRTEAQLQDNSRELALFRDTQSKWTEFRQA
jgi:hypothetical protein